MLNDHDRTPTMMLISDLNDFDEVSADAVEAARTSLGLTPPEMAASLGWSPRKYSRTLLAARDRGAVERDVALAVRGLLELRLNALNPEKWMPQDDGTFLNGAVHEWIMRDEHEEHEGWSGDIAPALLRLLVERVTTTGTTISYGEAATMLEDRRETHRVWPRTAYGVPLGIVCRAVLKLAEETGESVPPLSVIVTRAGGDPSDGIDGLVRWHLEMRYADEKKKLRKQLKRLKRDRTALMREVQDEVFAYPHWPGVLRALECEKAK